MRKSDPAPFHDAELFVGGGFNWVSWNSAGPSATAMSTMFLYNAFANDRIETKIGSDINDFEFVGLQLGGLLSTGSQSVYDVLSYEAGLSHFPLGAPATIHRSPRMFPNVIPRKACSANLLRQIRRVLR
jgi:hypothetical protein